MGRLPRRQFTSPFVITLAALPAATACYVQPAPAGANQVAQGPRTPPPVQPQPGVTPPPAQPSQPPPTDPAAPPTIVANPPRPATSPPPAAPTPVTRPPTHAPVNTKPVAERPPAPAPTPGPAATYDRRWTVSRSGASCRAFTEVSCPKPVAGKPTATCNPPPPQPYTGPSNLADGGSLKIVQYKGHTDCVVDRGPPCPANVRCNPPPPQTVDCPRW